MYYVNNLARSHKVKNVKCVNGMAQTDIFSIKILVILIDRDVQKVPFFQILAYLTASMCVHRLTNLAIAIVEIFKELNPNLPNSGLKKCVSSILVLVFATQNDLSSILPSTAKK